ncbi:MAG: hypothetical protein FWG78_04860 [Coriobacteriia bacterium]|nr:hypothetical protein [Coriobacteriia bacterium]
MKGKSIFRDERGSTSLTIIIALVLALALMASCLQWYWTSSSSTDIQTVADLSALAAGDVVAHSVMLIQTLDAFLLTLNLFGLLLHTIVLVAGVAVTVTAPIGGAGALPFLERAIEFDRKFCETRKKVAQEVKKLAEAINAATPVLAMAHGTRVVNENQALLSAGNGSEYVGIMLPAPLTGTVTLTNDPEGLGEQQEEWRNHAQENKENAQRAETLREDLERAIDECFRLDIYKEPSTQRAFWNPSQALDDYRREWERIAKRPTSTPNTPVAIDDTASTRSTLASRYLDYYEQLGREWGPTVLDAIGTPPLGDAPMTPQYLDLSTLSAPVWDQTVRLLTHGPDERKAYHQRTDCFGLSNAQGTLERVRLATVKNDLDHPPCTHCSPPHWRSPQMLEDNARAFIEQWNQQVVAILEYERIRAQIEEETSHIKTRTTSSIDEIVNMAKGYLAGNRLIYEPAGGRGVWSMVINTSSRTLPDYTLPALTGAGEVELGQQIALAGVRLMPSETESTLPSFLADVDAGTSSSTGLGGVVRSMMGDDSFIVPTALALWGTSLDVHGRGAAGLEKWSSGLPWGLDAIVGRGLEAVFREAQMTAPDMRKPIPTLVAVSDVGSPDKAGFEGSFARSLAQGKEMLEATGGASSFGLKVQVDQALQELSTSAGDKIAKLFDVEILGVRIPLPFSSQLAWLTSGVVEGLLRRMTDSLYRMPDVTW